MMRGKTLNPHAGSFIPGTNGMPAAPPHGHHAAGGWSDNNNAAAAAAGKMAMFPSHQPPMVASGVNILPRTVNLSGTSAMMQAPQAPPPFTASSTSMMYTAAPPPNATSSNQAPAPPPQLLSPAAMHRALIHLRLAVVNRCSLSSMPFTNAHFYFEHMMYTAYKTASQNSTTCLTTSHCLHQQQQLMSGAGSPPLKPFWRFFSTEQIASLAHAIVAAERSSSSVSPGSTNTPTKSAEAHRGSTTAAPRPPTAFTDEELDILKGIYYRNVHAMFPAALRKQLITATAALIEQQSTIDSDAHIASYVGGLNASVVDDAENFIVDVFWVTYRTVLLPSLDECGLQAFTAAIQFVSQLRLFLMQPGGTPRHVLGILLPLMTLSRYYVVLQRGAAGGSHDGASGPSPALLFSQHFMALIASFVTTSPFDTVETVHDRLTGASSNTNPSNGQVNGSSSNNNNNNNGTGSPSPSVTSNASAAVSTEFIKEWTPLFATTTSEVSLHVRNILDATASSTAVLPQVRWFHRQGASPQRPTTLLEVALGVSTAATTGVHMTNQAGAPLANAAMTPDSSYVTPLPHDANAATASSVDTLNTSSDPSEEVQFPAPVASSAFLDHVTQASSWCGDDEMVRFATLTLANTDLISLARLSQLFSGLKQAYATETGGTFEALMDILAQATVTTAASVQRSSSATTSATGGVPQGLQEVIEYLMFVIKPGNATHVQALEDASEIVDQRLEEQLAPRVSAAAKLQKQQQQQQQQQQQPPPHVSPPRLSGSAELRSGSPLAILALTSPQRGLSLDETAPLWQQDDSIAEMSVGDDAVLRNASVSSAFKASGSIW